MRTNNLFMAAMTALTLFSCAKESNDIDTTAENARLTIRIANPPATRAVEDPGTAATATVDYTKSYVFVATTNGAIKKVVELNATAADASGQAITQIPTNGQVFVAANIPAADMEAVKKLTMIEYVQKYAIKAASAGIFPNVVLSNATGVGVVYTATDQGSGTMKANVAISISPAMSRLELPQLSLKAESKIKSFTVKGIYLDKVFESFTFKGDKGVGTQVDIKQSIDNATIDYYKNEGNYASDNGVVTAAQNQVWAYQIPAGDTPNLIIKVSSVTMTDGSHLDGSDGSGIYYITARLNGTVTRASIYPMTGGLVFDESNLHPEPNPDLTGAEIEVKITPVAWTIGNLDYVLD